MDERIYPKPGPELKDVKELTKDKAVYVINRMLRDEVSYLTKSKTERMATKVIGILESYGFLKPWEVSLDSKKDT